MIVLGAIPDWILTLSGRPMPKHCQNIIFVFVDVLLLPRFEICKVYHFCLIYLVSLVLGKTSESTTSFFCCERLSASMARSLHLSLSLFATLRVAPWTRGEWNRG